MLLTISEQVLQTFFILLLYNTIYMWALPRVSDVADAEEDVELYIDFVANAS